MTAKINRSKRCSIERSKNRNPHRRWSIIMGIIDFQSPLLNPPPLKRGEVRRGVLSGISGIAALLIFSSSASAAELHDHGGQTFHAFTLEMDVGGSDNGAVAAWDFDGWIGGDDHKLWLKSEGERADGTLESAEFWTLYSRNVATFWDTQIGLRHDTQPQSTSYVVFGAQGLAPYYFETEAHAFLSDEGDVSVRAHIENDLLLTQKIILQPHAELNIFAQDVPDQDIGAGVSSGEIGLQTRYEFTRKIAPYIDFRYERKFGETSSIAKHHGEDPDNAVASVGLRLMF
jgi:copper resistance protein B